MKFNARYALAPAQNVKRVPPRFIPERQQATVAPGFTGRPATALFEWDGSSITWRAAQPRDLSQLLKQAAGIWPQDTDLSPQMLATSIDSDWVVRAGAPQQERIIDLCIALPEVLGNGMIFRSEPMERQAIVIRSKRQAAASVKNKTPDALQNFGQKLGHPIVLETDIDEKDLQQFIKLNQSGRNMEPGDVDSILTQMTQQTSLELKREKRIVPTWKLVPIQ